MNLNRTEEQTNKVPTTINYTGTGNRDIGTHTGTKKKEKKKKKRSITPPEDVGRTPGIPLGALRGWRPTALPEKGVAGEGPGREATLSNTPQLHAAGGACQLPSSRPRVRTGRIGETRPGQPTGGQPPPSGKGSTTLPDRGLPQLTPQGAASGPGCQLDLVYIELHMTDMEFPGLNSPRMSARMFLVDILL